MKKQKAKLERKHGKSSRDATGGMQVFQHPFSGIDPKVLKAALSEVADRKIEEFPSCSNSILQLFREKYPPHILSVMAGYGLQAGVSQHGSHQTPFKNRAASRRSFAIPGADVTGGRMGTAPAAPDDMQNAFDTIKELADAFHHRRFKAMEKERDEQARALLFLQECLRLHTQAVRNWGSYSQVIRISTELHAPLDDLFSDALGFSASDLISTGSSLVELLEERSNARFKWLRRVFRERKISRIVRAYYKNHPSVDGDPDEFIKIIPPETTREQLLSMLFLHADLLFVDMMQFSANQVAQASGLSEDVTERVLDALSLSPGDLCGERSRASVHG